MAKAQEADSRSQAEVMFDEQFDKGLPVKAAILHQALHAPGLPAERTLQQSKIPGIQMSWAPAGLFIKAPAKPSGMKRVVVAPANVGNFEV